MKKLVLGILVTFLISTCSSESNEYLVKFHKGALDEIGVPSGYLNSRGDTIIPLGKYYYCYTDTIRDFGMVIENETGKILGIDRNATELFQVFKYDDGPDYVKNGLFRIIKDDKIGYANLKGEIVIEPKFDCAYPFEGQFAKVADNCENEASGEHPMWKSDDWYQITKEGIRVDE